MTWLLSALLVLYPVGVTAAYFAGCTFVLFNDTVYVAVMTVAAVYAVVLSVRSDDFSVWILSLAAPVSLITAVFFLVKGMSPWIVIMLAICVGCCIWLSWKCGRPRLLKVISLFLAAALIVPVGFLGFIALIFGGIGKNTVVQTVSSPSGTYYAQLIDSDQGALGGDTLVEVHHSRHFNGLLFRIEKKPQLVYHGEWGEFQDMEISWKDDHCLLINSAEYRIG